MSALGASEPAVDVFLSYSHQNREDAEALAGVLAERGWSVWWDRDLIPGTEYERVIAAKLDQARCVIVLWSAAAAASRWVRAEAESAAKRGVAIVAVIEEGPALPVGLRGLQYVSLTEWEGEPSSGAFESLTNGVTRMLRGSGTVRPVLPKHPRAKRLLRTGTVIAPLALVAALGQFPIQSPAVRLDFTSRRLAFSVVRSQPLFTSPVRVDSLTLFGFDEVTLPDRRRFKASSVELATARGDSKSTMTLQVASLQDSARLTLAGDITPSQFRLSIERAPVIRVSLNGVVWLRVASESGWVRVLPGDVVAVPGKGLSASGFDFMPATASTPAFAPFRMTELDLNRRHIVREDDTSGDFVVSAIIKGTLTLLGVDRPSVVLDSASALNLRPATGQLTISELRDGHVRAIFDGQVPGLRDSRVNIPSVLDWLRARFPELLVMAAIIYVAAVAALFLSHRRRALA